MAADIREGSIQPIQAKDLRLGKERKILVPIEVPGVHITRFESVEPCVVAKESLEHAAQIAEEIIRRQDMMPHTELSGDLLSMAYAIRHYARKDNAR